MSAIQQLITDNIDIWTATDTGKRSGRGRASSNVGSVYGVKKLRELIYELAATGRVVETHNNVKEYLLGDSRNLLWARLRQEVNVI